MTTTLGLVETFGPTIQGEGPEAGRASSFVRFGGCNLSCSWCDSAYTWDAARYKLREQVEVVEAAEIVGRIPSAPLLIITGGEPLLQQHRVEAWTDFMGLAREKFPAISVETNGTQRPTGITLANVDTFIVSPKLPTVPFLHPVQDRMPWPGWGALADRTHFKIVVSEPSDIDLAVRLADDLGIPMDHLWLMPEGITPDALAERWLWVCEAAARIGCNASHRLHVLAWHDERGH